MEYKIKEYRKKRRMSQEELAKKANVSRTIISRLESQQDFETTAGTLKKVADALGVSVRSLFLP